MPRGFITSVGEACTGPAIRPAPADVRSGDEEADAHRHLLQHASPDVRRRRQPYVMDEWWRAGGGVVEHEAVRRDGRRGAGAGVDRADHGHERQWTSRRTRGAEPAGRSREGQADRRRLLWSCSSPRWVDLGISVRLPRFSHPIEPGSQSPRSEEHTSELQSLAYLVCRLLLEKKKEILSFRLQGVEFDNG